MQRELSAIITEAAIAVPFSEMYIKRELFSDPVKSAAAEEEEWSGTGIIMHF